MICIHHNDMDGRCAAAIVKRCIERGHPNEAIVYIEMDYKTSTPFERIQVGDSVVIVDFSLKPEDMDKLLGITPEVAWMDHHATAKDYPYQQLPGLRDFKDQSQSGAELTWKYFFPNQPMPACVKLVGSYDTFRHTEPNDISFMEGMKMFGRMNPDGGFWQELFDDCGVKVNGVIADGDIAIAVRDEYCAEINKSFGFETAFGGLRCYALNLYRFGSLAFAEKMQQYDACIAFIYDGKKYTVSVYSDKSKPVVSGICKAQGGGGHDHAAGFVCKHLPFAASRGNA